MAAEIYHCANSLPGASEPAKPVLTTAVLGGICPRQRVSVRGMIVLTDLTMDLMLRLIREVAHSRREVLRQNRPDRAQTQELLDMEDCKIVVMRQVKAACHLVLPARLARVAWRYASAALRRFQKRQSTQECPLSQSGRAGLSLPAHVVSYMFTKYHMRLREDATVALTAVVEVRARPLLRSFDKH